MVWEEQFHTHASLTLNDNMPTSVKSDITMELTVMVTVFWYVIYQITCCVTSQRIATIICLQSLHCFFKQPIVVSCEKFTTAAMMMSLACY